MKKAFSLVELLVVIAIIGVLAGVLLSTFSGGTESARAATCLSNLRNLGAACQSFGAESGHYPCAGSRESMCISPDDGKSLLEYTDNGPKGNFKGWISWNSMGAYMKDSKGKYPNSHKASQSWNLSAYPVSSEDDVGGDDAHIYCITNGTVWKYVNGNRSVYTCPEHVKQGYNPYWSYVMNAYFKWDTTKGRGAVPCEYSDLFIYYGNLANADKRLLFAEIPFAGIGVDAKIETSGESCDCILQYQGCPGCTSPEVIGFNHKAGKRNIYAHVCFADGHVEKLTYSGLSEAALRDLTKWLCEGKDVSFDGKQYKRMTND